MLPDPCSDGCPGRRSQDARSAGEADGPGMVRAMGPGAIHRARKMRRIRLAVLVWPFCLWAMGSGSWALESDPDQPATLEADDIEIDLRTGVRTYRGDVVYRQGSIRLDCHELVTHLNDDGELDRGICTGTPGRFRQRPEGSGEDVAGEAGEITMDQINRVVTLGGGARVTQGPNTITGRLITYSLDTERILVKGGVQTSGETPGETAGGKAGDAGTAVSGGPSEDAAPPPRARLVIQPRKKNN